MKQINQGFGLLVAISPDDKRSAFTLFPGSWELELDPGQNSNALAHF